MKHHLAQANVAYAKGHIDDPIMQDYHVALDEANTLAEQSPGFIWRYVSDSRNPLHRVFSDPLILFNFSVWESIEDLHHYTYKTMHAQLYAGRRQWFADWSSQAGAAMGLGQVAMWWIPAGQLPTVEEAKQKLLLIAAHGPTAQVFHFKKRYTPEESEAYSALDS